MVNKSAFKKTNYTASDFINAVNDFKFRENQKIAKEKEQANINQALAKLESDYREATTPIISMPQKKSGIEAIALNKPFQPTVSYKDIVRESGMAPFSNEGLKDKIVVNDEMYNAIESERERQKTNAELIENVQEAKNRMDSARKMNWFDKVMAELSGYDSTDYAKEDYKAAVEKYYQNRYQTDSDLNGILNSLVESNKQNPTEETKRDIDQISNVLYGKGVVDNLISDNAAAGLIGASYGITATVDALVGNLLKSVGWENNPISEYNDFVKSQYEYWANRGANAAAASGDTQNYSGQLIQGLVGIIPDTVMAIMTSGGSTATTSTLKAIAGSGTKTAATNAIKNVAKLEGKLSPIVSIANKSQAVANAASDVITSAAKNPMFWSSFSRTYGTDYEEAVNDGADEGTAHMYALITSLANALVEVGGGIQTLPSELQGKSKSWFLDYIKSNLEEGAEEVVQGLISELNKKLVYNGDVVINPLTMATEFAMGTAIGGIAGGGQVILNSANNAKYAKLGKTVRKSVDAKDLIDYAKKSADENIRNIAIENNSGKISNRDLGVLYSYAANNVQKAFKSASTIEEVNNTVTELANENNPKSINDIVFSAYLSKLTSLNLGEDVSSSVKYKDLFNLSAADKKVDPVQKSINAATGTKEYTADQNELKKIGQQFGAKVKFANLTTKKIDANGNEVIFSPEGTYDPDTNTITLNTDARPEHRPALFILKHELSHSFEKSGKKFEKFVGEVETSEAFEQYSKTRKNSQTGKAYASFDEWYDDIANRYRKAGKPLGNENITERTAAKYEAVAAFVADILFTSDTKTTEQFLKGLSLESQKGFIEAVKRFFARLKAFFVGDAKLSEVERLEKQFLEVANKVAKMNKAETEQQKTTTTEEGGGVKYSAAQLVVENLTETQYNNFGWVRANDVLTAAEYSALMSNYTKHKHINDYFPITRFGETVVHSSQHDNVLMYIKGNIRNPQITKVVKIEADEADVKEVILRYEREKNPRTLEIVKNYFGEWILDTHYRKDYDKYRQYSDQQKRNDSQASDNLSETEQNRKRGLAEDSRTYGVKYSLPDNATPIQIGNAYKNGEISEAEYEKRINALSGKKKDLNPVEIANLPLEAANTTPKLDGAKRTGTGDGESKLHGSLLGSDIITEELKQEIANDTFIKNYGTTTNKRTLNMAAQELEVGGAERVGEFKKLSPEKASPVDVAVGLILLERYQRANDTEGALEIAEKLREIATVSGQTVQIFSVIGRFTPEMMATYAQRDLKKAYLKLVEGRSQKWIDKNAKKFELTEKEKQFIMNHTVMASQLEDGSRAKAILLAEITAMLQDKIPSEFGDKLRALQRTSLLLNVKTNLKNILGNGTMVLTYLPSDFFGNLIDKGIAKKTGVRTTGNFQFKGSGTAFKKGMYEAYDDFKRGIHTKQEELNRFDNALKGGKAFNENGKIKALNYVAKFCNKMDNFTSFCLEMGDRPFFEMWFNNSLNNQMRLNKTDIPTPEMLEIAKEEALQRTWQDNNKVSRGVQKAKEVLNLVHIPGVSYGLGDFALKFTKTPANIGKAMVEFSPVGLALAAGKARKLHNALETGKFTPKLQKELVKSTSNAIVGTLTYVMVAVAASLGWVDLSGEGDEDKKVSAFEKYVVGIPPYSMKVFGTNISYDWNQPMGAVLATVADFMDSKNDDVNSMWYEDIVGAIKAGGTVFTKQSFLSGLYELFSQDDFVTGIFASLVSEPSAFIPQVASQVASLIDPYKRTTYDPKDSFKSSFNSVINKIPGLRQTLPKQVNVLGEDVKNVQYLNPWEAFASPGNRYPESSGKVAEEIYKLYTETNNVSVLPKTAPNSLTVAKQDITFSVEEKAEFQKKIGKTSVELLDKLFDSKDFENLTDEQKVKAIKKVYDYAYDKAKTTLDYDYETIAEMEGGQDVLTKEKYDKLSKEAKQSLVDEYLLTKKQRKCKGDAEKLAELFIKEVIKDTK